MKAVKIIIFALVALVVAAGALSFTLPTQMHSDRSIVIKASRAVVFEQVRTLSNMQKWSPWAEKDPNMKTSIAGTDGTVGAMYKWEGNDDVGAGEQTIAKIEDQKLVDVNLHFLKPFESNATAHVMLEDDPNGVKVTWGFDGKMARPWNVLSLFMDMEKSVGDDFAKGLEKLKVIAEKEAASMPVFEITETTIEPHTYVGIRKEVGFTEISNMFSENLPKIFADAGNAGMKPAGAPVGLYYSWDEKAMKTDMATGVPVPAGKKLAAWQTFYIKGGKALTIDYYGAYDKSANAHYAMDKYIADKKYKQLAPVMEEYITGPMSEPDTTKWLTKIIYFVE